MDARRHGDENPKSSVVAETLKLLVNSSYGCQIMDRSRHTLTKNLTDEKTQSAITSRMFQRPKNIPDQLHQVKGDKSETEDREPPIIVGFLILQYTKLRMMQFY